ncbi:acyl carrier protein [Marinobacter shengliensis]|uniref:acyl carrier protein n=1 Tax=Marinobacter shengliensis TaxID=1389223 RepID=UPI00110929F0|nr:acyl carrier protein [Marinobacter shengliensis]
MTDVREVIIESIHRIAEENDLELSPSLNDDSVLLESGLDSLGFAILVADLEGSLGFDPFVMMDEPVYPNTLREFVAIYKMFSPKEAQA